MKEGEKQRKFHEALLKMLYPPPSQDDEEKEVEPVLIESLNDPPEEEEIESEQPSRSSSDDNDGKLTRAQRKRLRRRKLKEAASSRRKIIGPLLPGSNDDIDHSCGGSIEDMSNVSEEVRRNTANNFSADQCPESVEGEEASCRNKKKLKMKERRNSKKISVANSTQSSATNHNQGPKVTTDHRMADS